MKILYQRIYKSNEMKWNKFKCMQSGFGIKQIKSTEIYLASIVLGLCV